MVGTSWKKRLHFASAESRVNQSAGRAKRPSALSQGGVVRNSAVVREEIMNANLALVIGISWKFASIAH
jgi:hypothetical protein